METADVDVAARSLEGGFAPCRTEARYLVGNFIGADARDRYALGEEFGHEGIDGSGFRPLAQRQCGARRQETAIGKPGRRVIERRERSGRQGLHPAPP